MLNTYVSNSAKLAVSTKSVIGTPDKVNKLAFKFL